jgi:DNA-binding transcriptional LysR family regulator
MGLARDGVRPAHEGTTIMTVQGLDLRHLEIFARVVQEGGITPAARSLGLTQPTVSGHIQTLEKDAGVVLFHRGGGRARPTAAGDVLYNFAKAICEQKRQAQQALEKLLGLRTGELVVGASTTPATYWLPERLVRFREQHPSVHVDLVVDDTRRILERLDEGTIEIAIVGEAIDPERYRTRKLADDEVMLVVGRVHPWFARAEVDPKELAGQRIVAREEGSATLGSAEEKLTELGLHLGAEIPIVLRLPTNEAIREAVARGGVAAFLPVACIAGRDRELHAIALRGISIRRPFTAVRSLSREPSPAATAFLALLVPSP